MKVGSMTSAKNAPNTQRPLGVWVLTIHSLIFAGIFPIRYLVLFAITGNIEQLLGGNRAANTFLSVLCTCILFVSIAAWQGKEKARIILVILITIYYLFDGINILLYINSARF